MTDMKKVLATWRGCPCPARCLYAGIGLVAAVLFLMPWVPSVQDEFLAKQHLRSSSFAKWAFLQVFPSMYNFQNEIWVSSQPVPKDMLEGRTRVEGDVAHRWVNHYPLRMVSFHRSRTGTPAGQYYVYIRSRYRGRDMNSSFLLTSDGRQAILERLE